MSWETCLNLASHSRFNSRLLGSTAVSIKRGCRTFLVQRLGTLSTRPSASQLKSLRLHPEASTDSKRCKEEQTEITQTLFLTVPVRILCTLPPLPKKMGNTLPRTRTLNILPLPYSSLGLLTYFPHRSQQ